MATVSFDPFRAQQRLQWRNRIATWRADSTQSGVHAAALGALASLLAWPAWQGLQGVEPAAQLALQHWPSALALVAGFGLAWQQAGMLARTRQRDARDWLQAQPVAEALRRRRERDRRMRLALLQAGAGAMPLLAIDAARAASAWIVLAAVAAIVAPRLVRRPSQRGIPRTALRARVASRGAGRLWRWQLIETAVALRGQRVAPGLWALLLIPMGSGVPVVLAVAAAGVVLALLSTAWSRSLGVLPQAQHWLAPQPLRGAALLHATLAVPGTILALACALVAGVLFELGTPRVAVFAVFALASLGALHFAACAAERARPRRIALRFALHAALWLAALQTLPPLLIASWPLQLGWLMRDAMRR
jgi:hypothetical protein